MERTLAQHGSTPSLVKARDHGGPNGTRIDAVIANATASVAEVCDVQVGQVKAALSVACESEVLQLRSVLADTCAGETQKLRGALSQTCDQELRRVQSSLTTACAREVDQVSQSCHQEVDRVKLALQAACEREVAAVRLQCQQEVASVKSSLRAACEAEVALVRDVCQHEVARVKDELAEACHSEVVSLVAAMRRDAAKVRTEQLEALRAAEGDYMRDFDRVHSTLTTRMDAMQHRAGTDAKKLAELSHESARMAYRLGATQCAVRARLRADELELELRAGCPFLTLRVHRPAGLLSGRGGRPTLKVGPQLIRLSRDADTLLLAERPESDLPLPSSLADDLARNGEPAEHAWSQIPLDSLVTVSLGAPGWVARGAGYEPATAAHLSEEGQAALFSAGVLSPTRGGARLSLTAGTALHPERTPERLMAPDFKGTTPFAGAEAEAEGDTPRFLPPTWRFVTLQPVQGTPIFLLAPSDAAALSWVTALAPLCVGSAPRPAYASHLWRRVRLRLGAASMATGLNKAQVLATMLRSMAEEEEARVEWVRFHLAHGDGDGAARLGWIPTTPLASPAIMRSPVAQLAPPSRGAPR